MPQLFILMKLFREQNPIHHGARGAKRFLLCYAAVDSLPAMFLCEIIPPDKFVFGARAQRELSNRELLLM